MLGSGCYLNTGAYFYRNASYTARAEARTAKTGEQMLTDGTHYYLELERFYVGPQNEYFLSIFDIGQKKQEKIIADPSGVKELFEIPEDYAMYLAGKGKKPAKPTITRVEDQKAARKAATNKLTIVAQPLAASAAYNYSAKTKALWYTAGVFETICVDIPMSCVATALAIVGGGIYVYTQVGNDIAKVQNTLNPKPKIDPYAIFFGASSGGSSGLSHADQAALSQGKYGRVD